MKREKAETRGQKLAKILDEIRMKRICAYGQSPRCDCKFGADRIGIGLSESGNGCPEMRDAIWILRNMTDSEFKRISERKPSEHFFDALSR